MGVRGEEDLWQGCVNIRVLTENGSNGEIPGSYVVGLAHPASFRPLIVHHEPDSNI